MSTEVHPSTPAAAGKLREALAVLRLRQELLAMAGSLLIAVLFRVDADRE